jgi:hypothetical protein
MLALKIPKILFNGWFWLAIIAILIAIHYFWGKAPPPKKPGKFYLKHKKTITRITDIFLISVFLLGWFTILYRSLPIAFEPIFNPPSSPLPLAEHFKSALGLFSTVAIPILGTSGMLIGMLSIFQSNLTKGKRIILIVISLLPIVFTVLLLLITGTEIPEARWSTIKLGLGALAVCWVFNGPAIITGTHFIKVSWAIMRRLKLVSGNLPE